MDRNFEDLFGTKFGVRDAARGEAYLEVGETLRTMFVVPENEDIDNITFDGQVIPVGLAPDDKYTVLDNEGNVIATAIYGGAARLMFFAGYDGENPNTMYDRRTRKRVPTDHKHLESGGVYFLEVERLENTLKPTKSYINFVCSGPADGSLDDQDVTIVELEGSLYKFSKV